MTKLNFDTIIGVGLGVLLVATGVALMAFSDLKADKSFVAGLLTGVGFVLPVMTLWRHEALKGRSHD